MTAAGQAMHNKISTDARPAGTAYGLVYPRATQGTLLSHTPVQDPQF
jgi:hypothetical protein